MPSLTPTAGELAACINSGDGRPLAARIQQAIDCLANAGGGRLALGPGDWLCATIFLRSKVELHLTRGCRLVADSDMTHYRPVSGLGDDVLQHCRSLLVAQGCEQVALSGPGVIDGSCMEFWQPCETEDERPHGIFRYKPRQNRNGALGPLIEFAQCRDLIVEGITIVNSPGWTLHLYDCDHASVRHVTIRNNRLVPYTDGIGINGSRDVRVSSCDVETGDDAIIVKATKQSLKCERVTVTNCVASSNCSAFGLGADAAGEIRDIVFSDCVSAQALRMIQVEQWYAGIIERAIFSNITGRTLPDDGIHCERPIYVDIQQWTRRDVQPGEASPPLGTVRDLVFHNILCETRGRIVLTAQDGSRIRNVALESVYLRIPQIEDPAATVPAARSMQLSNYNPETRAARALLVADNVTGMLVRDLRVDWPADPKVPMHATCLRRCEGLRLESPALTPSQPEVPFSCPL